MTVSSAIASAVKPCAAHPETKEIAGWQEIDGLSPPVADVGRKAITQVKDAARRRLCPGGA
jgi:hypothetical protein